jgi:hypothetical protein
MARLANLAILLIGLAVMTQLASIQGAWRAALLLGAGLGPLLVLRWLWWRVSAWGELACIAVSLVAALPLLGADLSEATRLLTMAGLATCTGVAVSCFTPEDPERLRTFFERTRPPGFWGPVAVSAGSDPRAGVRQLGRGTLALGATALSLFCLLTGFGSWLARSPTPSWWQVGPEWWVASLLFAGVALVPVWWWLGFREQARGGPPPSAAGTRE